MPFRKLNEIVNLNEIYFFVILHLIQDPYSKRLLQKWIPHQVRNDKYCYTFTCFHLPFRNQIIPMTAIKASAKTIDKNTPSGPMLKVIANKYASGN